MDRPGRSATAGPTGRGRPSGGGPAVDAAWNTTNSSCPSRTAQPARPLSRERGREIVADDVDPVGPVVDPQREPQVGVRPDVVVDHPGGPLRRQHEVHPEAATALGDPDERRQETRDVLRHRRELVDHDHQAGQRRATTGPVLAEVGGTDGTEELFATRQLRLEAHQGALGETPVEVGHHPDGVRQRAAPVERGAALVVDQHELQMGGRHAGGEADDHRAQQFALARSRSSRRSSACGPSRSRSSSTTPSADAPTTTARGGSSPPACHASTIVATPRPRTLGMQRAERQRCGHPGDRVGHILGVGESGECEGDAPGDRFAEAGDQDVVDGRIVRPAAVRSTPLGPSIRS